MKILDLIIAKSICTIVILHIIFYQPKQILNFFLAKLKIY